MLLITEWEEFRHLEWAKLQQAMEVPVLIDGRNFLDPEELRRAGFEYQGMGRGGSAIEADGGPAERKLEPSPVTAGSEAGRKRPESTKRARRTSG